MENSSQVPLQATTKLCFEIHAGVEIRNLESLETTNLIIPTVAREEYHVVLSRRTRRRRRRKERKKVGDVYKVRNSAACTDCTR